MSDGVPDLRGGHSTTIIAIVVPIVSLLGMFGGLVWQAAKYPDRSEFNANRNDTIQTKQDVAIMKVQFGGFVEEMRDWRRQQEEQRREDRTNGKRPR